MMSIRDLLILTLLVPAVHAQHIELLDVGSGTGVAATAPTASPTAAPPGSGAAVATGNRFVELVQAGERSLGAFNSRRTLDRKDRDLRQAVACFKQALALRERARIQRVDVGAYLYLPDLDMALVHYYLGNHGAALACLELPRAQRVPAGADVSTRDHILAQSTKARHLHGRLNSPFLPAHHPIAQRDSFTCGPTAVAVQLEALGLTNCLATLETRRAAGSGSLPEMAADGIAVAAAAGVEMDAVWTERPRTSDPEAAFPSGVTAEGIRDLLSRGHPVLVAVRSYTKPETGALAWTPGHFVLAVGAKADAAGRVTHIFVMDPDGGTPRRFDRAEFEATWQNNTRGALALIPRSLERRFRARLGVSTMFDPAATSRSWVGKPASAAD